MQPDIITMAKGIASGLPLGVATARAGVMDWTPGAHASTFGGNPVSCAAALTTIRLLQEQLVANAADVGATCSTACARSSRSTRIIGDVRGKGLMIGVELVKDRVTKVRATAERDRVVDEAFARGLLVLGAGRNTLRLSPPLVLTRAQAQDRHRHPRRIDWRRGPTPRREGRAGSPTCPTVALAEVEPGHDVAAGVCRAPDDDVLSGLFRFFRCSEPDASADHDRK